MAYLQFLHQVLHLMKYLVINGHSEFRAQLRHNAEAVKKAVSKYQLGSGHYLWGGGVGKWEGGGGKQSFTHIIRGVKKVLMQKGGGQKSF